jgi:hypothetical protein
MTNISEKLEHERDPLCEPPLRSRLRRLQMLDCSFNNFEFIPGKEFYHRLPPLRVLRAENITYFSLLKIKYGFEIGLKYAVKVMFKISLLNSSLENYAFEKHIK